MTKQVLTVHIGTAEEACSLTNPPKKNTTYLVKPPMTDTHGEVRELGDER